MAESQTTHPVYELKVDVSNTSRLFEYYMLKDYILKEHTILDIGCNTGTGMDILSHFSDHVYGIDVVPALEGILKEKYKNNPKVKFVIVSEGEVPFADNFFDAIVANNFIEHVEDPAYYLKKFKALLKPNGTLYLTTVNRKNRLYFWQKPYNVHHYTEFSPWSLKRMLNRHFAKVECQGIIKEQPFFPDYIGMSAERKFRLGVKYPVLNFLKRIKAIFSPDRTVAKTKIPDEISIADLASEKFSLDDFRESFKYLKLDTTNKKEWIELFAICKKQ